MSLLEPHRKKLAACGLTPETWGRARLHSGSSEEVKELLGYGTGGGGLVIPYDEAYSRVRIDNPGPDGGRYRSPRGHGNRLYLPSILDPAFLAEARRPLYVTEGEFKALKASQDGFPCVALPGVWSWKTQLHSKSFPVTDLDRVVWHGRKVIIVFDSDVAEKPPVAWAEHALVQELRTRGADVYVIRLPHGPHNQKVGLDDYLVSEGADAFKRLPMLSPREADAEPPTFLRSTELGEQYLQRTLQSHHRISLGYPELDAILRSIAPGEVLTILARPAVGKTAFALNLMEWMSASERLPTLFFSLEQQGVEVFERMASMLTGWTGREIEAKARGQDPHLTARLLDVCERWFHVVVVEKPCTLEQIDHLLEQAQNANLWAGPLRLVVVDYLGLIGQTRPASTYDHTSRVARELKNFAKRHRVALVVACQVDREGDSGGKDITLRMARDSGVIEEAADYLLGLWRPELAECIRREERLAVQGQLKVRVLKNRSGPTPKTITLQFDPDSLRITGPTA